MYTVSLWSIPFEENTPVRLLQAQEKALLQDLDQAIEHRIENKIASARRFAVCTILTTTMIKTHFITLYLCCFSFLFRFGFGIMQKWSIAI